MPSKDFPFTHRVEVRFRDCDPMGHVNHAVYLTYLEACRFAFWRRLTGRPFGGDAGIILARAECDYRAPAMPGDALDVGLDVVAIGKSSFTLGYAILDAGTRRLIAEGRTVLVAYDYSAGRSIPLPDEVRRALEAVSRGEWSSVQ